MARFFSFPRRLRSDQRGATMVEFGMIAPVLALLTAGIIDLSRGISETYTLQQAVNRSLEMLMARPPQGDAEASDVDYSYLINEVAVAAGVTTDKVTLTRWLQCNGVKNANYTAACPDGQETARYLRLAVVKDFEGQFFLGTRQISVDGAVRIQ